MPNGDYCFMKRLLSVPEVADRFAVTTQTVRNWIAAGRLVAAQPAPRGRYRIPIDALQAFERAAGMEETPGVPRSEAPSPDHGDTGTRRRLLTGRSALDAELERVVAAIVASVHPRAVLLFGSRARGDFKSDSDFDLAIVATDGSERRRIAMEAYESLARVPGRSVGVDLVVLTPQLISAERDLVGSIARVVVREGVPVYGSATLA